MPSLVLLIWFAVCAEQDIRQRHIANVLTLGGAAFALFYLFYSGHTWLGASVEEGGEALAIAMLLTLPGYMTGRLGAADVKLLGALALATDPMHLLGTLIGAGMFCLLWLLGRNKLWKLLSQPLRKRLATLAPDTSEKPPFAPFLLAGFLMALVWIH